MDPLPPAARWLPAETFAGQVAVVTGGGTGLGLEISRGLAALGAQVVIASRTAEHHAVLLDEARARGWNCEARVLDVRQPAEVRTCADAIVAAHGRVDILVNNAAGNFVCPTERLSANAWRAVLSIVLDGTFYCSQHFGRHMIKQKRGQILNVVATYAWTGMAGVAHSASAKAGVLALTKTLAAEWAPHGIRANAIAPGPFHSQGAQRNLWPNEEAARAIREQIPLQRFGTAEEVAAQCLHLLSPASEYITGECLVIDGGATLGTPMWREPGERAVNREQFPTELANPNSAELDTLDAGAAFDVMNAEDAGVAAAVRAAKAEIVRAVELVSERLARGGRLFYVGAGTSGRLGVLDASECPPTFCSDPAQVQGIIAGGNAALTNSIEGAEDDRAGATRELEARAVGPKDVVFGIAAGGTTPYVHGALETAKKRGSATIFFACVPRELALDSADISIRVVAGPEVLAGSTRLKAGTATKMVLNMITTLSMARIGKVHGNLMVDVQTAGNAKLWQRGIGLVARIVECDRAKAEQLLKSADGSVKVAALMGRRKLDAHAARLLLEHERGSLRRALGS